MEIEHDIKVIPVNDSLPSELERLTKEGWQLSPGVMPVAIYHLVRQKQPTIGGMAKLIVDDTKIHIIKADGTMQ